MKRLPLPIFVLAAMSLLIAGCGDSDKSSSSSSETPAKSANTVDVSIKDIAFKPATAKAKIGQTVRWTNNDPVGHNVVAESGADFSSDTLNTGDTYDYKAATAGTIDYHCTIHPGQEGKLVVTK